jgi:hypothetical protein
MMQRSIKKSLDDGSRKLKSLLGHGELSFAVRKRF